MNKIYSESVQERADDYRLLQEATKQLEEMLGKSVELATVEWKFEQDSKGRPLYVLKLKDNSGELGGGLFAPDELRSPSQMRFRLYRLWGDLLQKKSLPRIAKLINGED